jgi:hypothetical protein
MTLSPHKTQSIMALQFEVYSKKESVQYVDLVTVEEAAQGGTIRFYKPNYDNLAVSVALFIDRPNGTSDVVPCGKQLSSAIREGKVVLNDLWDFMIKEGPDGNNVIPLPSVYDGANSPFLSLSAKDKKKSTFKPESVAKQWELSAW